MSEIVSIKIRIDGKDGFKSVKVDVADLNKAINLATAQAEKFNKSIIDWSHKINVIEGLTSAVSILRDSISGLVAGYNDDQVGLAKLTQAMRNTMDASDEMVASVEELIDAQLAGAQELATYLQLEGSLKTLIPVMNDMIAAIRFGIKCRRSDADCNNAGQGHERPD